MTTTMQMAEIPETEVEARPRRRTFPKEYKLGILEQADRCTGSGEIGELLGSVIEESPRLGNPVHRPLAEKAELDIVAEDGEHPSASPLRKASYSRSITLRVCSEPMPSPPKLYGT